MKKTAEFPAFLAGSSEMARRLQQAQGPIAGMGAPAEWQSELRMAVSLCLNTNIPTAIYWGNDLRLIYNDAWAPIAGEKHPWALGRRADEVWQDIWDIIGPQLQQVVENGSSFIVADQLLPMRRGGRVQKTHWDYSFAPIFDSATGKVAGVFNQGNETTARLAAERALRASEQRLEYALGASDSVGTWDWDVPNDLVTSDARFARQYGISPELAAHGAPLAAFMQRIHPDDVEGARSAIDVAMRTGEKMATEYRLIDEQGAARWVTAQGRCTLAPDGTGLRFPGVSFDITARKEAEAALRDSEERFKAITNSIDQMIWATRPDGYHDYYNQRWYDFTGMPHGSTDGDGWNGIFHPDDQARAWSVWAHSLRTGQPYHIEYRLRHHTGVYRWVLGRAQPVRDEHGEIARWFGTCTDIQEIVDAREVLARSREELEQAIAQRTNELLQAEERLRQAEKMEAIGQLSGGIAHDFNNMLAVVLGSLSLFERRRAKGDVDLDRFIEAAKDGATRAANLTQRLLAFSRKQPLKPSAIHTGQLVEGMFDMLSRTLGDDVRVCVSTQTTSWHVHADVSQLENAILNLAVNARDAMPSGGRLMLEVKDRTFATDQDVSGLEPGDYVEILVADEGVGMDPDTLSKAFDPFFTTKEVGRGTGLGLSQVFGFVKQSGGQVKIDSTTGLGTQVRIFLPRELAGQAKVQATVQTQELNATGALVLVVEDDDRVRAFSCEALRDLGYDVIEARDGMEAIRKLADNPDVAILFTDVVMPGINGRQLALLARESSPRIKVLFTTGYERDDLGPDSLGRTDELILRKPFEVNQLAQALNCLQAE